MKIGVVVDNEYHSDVRVKREVRLLKTFGFEVFVLCLSHSNDYSYEEEGTTIIPISLSRKIKNTLYFFMNLLPFYERWWSKQVQKFVETYQVDVIHTHDLYMAKAVKGGIQSTGKKIPMILDLHENYPHAILSYKWTQGVLRSSLVNPRKWLKKEGEYLRLADRIVVLSEDFKQSLLSRYAFLENDHLTIFPNVVDTHEFDTYPVSPRIADRLPVGPRVLYFGVVATRRGIFRSLHVCERLLLEGLNFSLVIIGPIDSGDKDLFHETIGKSVFRNHLTYIPWIDLSELPSYLAACDIALAPFDKNPQHESGVANKIFQYMYGKLPILASNCKPQQELIEQYKIGEIFTLDEEFEAKLRILIADENSRKEMGERAHQTLMTEFHQDTFLPRLKALYQGLSTDAQFGDR